jgi:hypothetical protein
MLFEDHSEENPVAIVKTKSDDSRGKQIRKPKHFKADEMNEAAQFCRSESSRYYPSKTSNGIVKDILFEEVHNPNFGDYLSYVLVDFLQYCGPPFILEHPTWVPILQHQLNPNANTYVVPASSSLCSFVMTGLSIPSRDRIPVLYKKGQK